MPFYRVDFRHTPTGTRNLVAHAIIRRPAAEKAIESVGGRLVGLWYTLGETDGFAVVEAPDNEAVVAAVLKINAAGGVTAWTTALLTPEEFYEALKNTSRVQYEPPQGAPKKQSKGKD
jgi:uncharacterized protein with GYD domain